MIIQIASPGGIEGRWRNMIQNSHQNEFNMYMTDIDKHWWFLSVVRGQVAGFAGTKNEYSGRMFLGPCTVFKEFRGHGIQREFIKAREDFARKEGYDTAITYVHYKNYPSANNFLRSDYLIAEPWSRFLLDDGTYIYFKKVLNK